MTNITVYDNVVSKETSEKWYQECVRLPYRYGERDRLWAPSVGFSYDFNGSEELYKNLFIIATEHRPELKEKQVQRSYINLFTPSDRPYFHKDGPVTTCLFYINPETSIEEGGETQFLDEDKIIGVLPKPGRLVMFDGNIMHRATSFRSIIRITIALKFFA
jgi:hypothetical protein